MHIVDVPIIVVVNSVVGDFVHVDPGLRGKVFVCIIKACVYNCDNNFRVTFLNCPRPRHVNQRQIPLLLKAWVVRDNFGCLCLTNIIEFDSLNQRVYSVACFDGM